MPDMPLPCPPDCGLCASSLLQGNSHVEFSRNRSIPVEENRRKYILENAEHECIAKVKVDGGVLASHPGKKADYLFIRCEHNIAYFVELKGCDITKACEQILSTIILFQGVVGNINNINARVVCSRVPAPDLRSTHYRRLENHCKSKNGTLIIKAKKLKENIVST